MKVFDEIKWFAQRGKRGWADCDWWGMDYYLTSIIVPMLKELKKHTHGHPGGISSLEEWKEILNKMTLGFEASKRIADCKNWVMNEGNEMFTDEKGYIQFKNPWTPEQIKNFKLLDKKDDKTYQDGMKLFSKWFLNLWD